MKIDDVPSLIDLSAKAAVYEYNLFDKWLKYLPKAVLYTLLLAAVRFSRVLSLRRLICNWPLEQLVLKDCKHFYKRTAVIFAHCLQREKPHHLKVIDLRGCEIGYVGTVALMKLAVGMPVIENDNADMPATDGSQWETCIVTNETLNMELSRPHQPISVLTSCDVNKDNFGLVKQALILHTILDLKVTSLSAFEIGRRKVQILLSLVESDVLNELNIQMNSLESAGVTSVAPIMAAFRNLTTLNLAYNNLRQTDSKAISMLSVAVKNMKLKSLDLSGNYIKSAICQILKAVSTRLSKLLLNGCGIHHKELQMLSTMDQVSELEHLELASNGLVQHMDSLTTYINKLSPSLRYLNLDENMFHTSTVNTFCSLIGSLEVLVSLSISYNHFLPEDREVIAQTFPHLQIANYQELLF